MEDIDQIYQKYPESNTIEYKRDLQIYSEKDTKEFLADVSSFANANGGTIFYGIDEEDGLVGLDLPELDSFQLRIQQKIEDGIFPRPAFKIVSVIMPDGKYILIIKVQKSFSGPHSIKSSDQYFYRSEAGKRRMDHFQLKSAFLNSSTIKDNIERFCNKKISEIILKETPVHLSNEAVVAMFLIPINTWNDEINIESAQLRKSPSGFEIMDDGGGIMERNFDGFIKSSHNKGYIQLYRNGIIESVSSSLSTHDIGEGKCIPTAVFQEEIHLAFERGLFLFKSLEINPPFIGLLFLLGAQNHLPPPNILRNFSKRSIGKEVLRFPELYVTEFPSTYVQYTRKWFDFLWQGFGLDKCPDITEEGILQGARKRKLI